MTKNMKDALQKINTIALSSFQDSMHWKDECGRIAREALAAEEESERKSWHDEHADEPDHTCPTCCIDIDASDAISGLKFWSKP